MAAEQPTDRVGSVTKPPGQRLVLMVEDNSKNVKLMRDILQFHGYRTAEAVTAEEGISIAVREHPDLILMDVRLPGIDGLGALGQLRADPRTSTIPVVAVTASVMPDERDHFSAAGFDGFIAKPIDIREFPKQIESYFVDAPQR
jgi:two-component system cell cycle response regulator DivK